MKEIVEFCNFLGHLYKIESNFENESEFKIMIKTLRDFEEFVGKKGGSKMLISRLSKKFDWLFIENAKSGYKFLLDKYKVLIAKVDSKYDGHQRKITPEKVQMRPSQEFLENFLMICIELTSDVLRARYINSRR